MQVTLTCQLIILPAVVHAAFTIGAKLQTFKGRGNELLRRKEAKIFCHKKKSVKILKATYSCDGSRYKKKASQNITIFGTMRE